MHYVKQIIRTTILYSASLVIALGYPLTALAEDPATTTTPTSTPTTTTTAPPVTAPTTTSSSTPTTTTPTPTPPPPQKTYTYDAATQHWNTGEWKYDGTTGAYKPVPAPVTPASPTVIPPQSATQQPTNQTTNTAGMNAATSSSIANALDSLATTGSASILHNTAAGSATTGDANATTTIVNRLNSSMTNGSNQEAASFVSNVMGNVNGDIMLQPMLLKAMLEAGAVNNQTTAVANSANINNDVTLSAQSGDANVLKNTKAGDATTGSANTVANVVNVVNSMIAANKSFVGTINIYGNLNGDILIAPDFIPQLLADNTSTSKASSPAQIVNATDTQSIVNNVALAAKSGQAAVTGNTAAGNATTGPASTNTVIFNLSGHEIVASNSLLVFINVLGKWVGVIVDAPAGATAAAIGNGVTSNTKITPNLVLDASNDTKITNNITLASQSGNATVAGNTLGGNATSGAATSSANIANISNSQLGLSGWFGVLFINVFGSWNGSFGVNTSAGDPIIASAGYRSKSGVKRPTQVISFIPHSSGTKASSITLVAPQKGSSSSNEAATTSSSANSPQPYVARTANVSDIPSSLQSASASSRATNVPLLVSSFVLIGASLFGLRKYLF